MMEDMSLEGTSGDYLVQTSAPRRVSCRSFLRATFSQVLSASKDGGSTICLGSLLFGLTTLTIRKFLLIFKWYFLIFSFCPLAFILTQWRVWLWLLYSPSQAFIHTDKIAPQAVPGLSASPQMSGDPNPWLSLWFFVELSPVCPCLL